MAELTAGAASSRLDGDVMDYFRLNRPIPKLKASTLPHPGQHYDRLARLRFEKEEQARAERARLAELEVVEDEEGLDPLSLSERSGNLPLQMNHSQRLKRLKDTIQRQDEALLNQEADAFPTGMDTNPNAEPGDDDYEYGASDTLYDQYSFDVDHSPRLPIADVKADILATIESNPVTIIQGATGSGKSSQVPQYILQHYAKTGTHCNIICTQPRRIAATSVAKFVCNCREWGLGTLVGYQIAMDKVVSEDTRLTFVTTGVLLQKLIKMKNMNQFTHIILDEVHERDQDTDFCLLVVRKLLRTNSRHVKVILMSATLESDLFSYYFSSKSGGQLMQAPVVTVEGSMYSVTTSYLDSLVDTHKVEKPDLLNARLSNDALKVACKLISSFDAMEAKDPSFCANGYSRGTVLVFLPGLPEIHEMDEKMLEECKGLRLTVLPLHSSISGEDQNRVFLKPEPGRRKVILATNIAESSITVPDIKYVIDFCLVKELTCDQETNYQCLMTNWASKASLSQRTGRAGRVAAGKCYRLITQGFFAHLMDFSIPEMQRCPLETVVLRVKLLDLGDPRHILSLALQPPNLSDLERTILSLKEVGALTLTLGGVGNKYDGDLTFLGRVLASLPLDVKLGKLLALGHVFGYLEECLVIAAGLSTKSFFQKPYKLGDQTFYKSKMGWDHFAESDCITILNAYKEWFQQKDSGRFRFSGKEESSWCSRNLIRKNVINEVADLVRELTSRLATLNIRTTRKLIRGRGDLDPHERLILKLVLCGAFYPNYFHWGACDDELSQKEMSGHDPTTTVMLSGLPSSSELYSGAIFHLFRDCGYGKALHFEGQKVFLEYKKPPLTKNAGVEVPKKALEAVQIALRKRNPRQPIVLCHNESSVKVLLAQGELERLRSLSESSDYDDPEVLRFQATQTRNHDQAENLKQLDLPTYGRYKIAVTEVINAGHFWAQFSDQSSFAELKQLMDGIWGSTLSPLVLPPGLMLGKCCLALFSEDKHYYRARIISVYDDSGSAEVIFVDYGNMEVVSFDYLCKLPAQFTKQPIMAFECYLTCVKPSLSLSPDGVWVPEATRRFKRLTLDKSLEAVVYSKLWNELRVELYDCAVHEGEGEGEGEGRLLINKVLVDEGFATKIDEPSTSKLANTEGNRDRQLASMTKKKKEEAEEVGPYLEHDPARKNKDSSASSSQRPRYSSTLHWCSALEHEFTSMQRGTLAFPRGRVSKVAIKGPNSPYEVRFYPMTVAGSQRPARVEKDSVNSIVVDCEPQDKKERLMVSAHVALNTVGTTVLARHTTLFPNIHGLAHLAVVLFSPYVELRVDELMRQYTGALCGLGFDPSTGESLYGDHDIELTFDTLFTQEDLEKINRIRTAINLMMAVGTEDSHLMNWGPQAIQRIQTRATDLLKDLILNPRRVSVPQVHSTKFGWNQVDPSYVMGVREQMEEPQLYPLISKVRIKGERIDQQRPTKVLLLREKIKQLRKKVSPSQVPMDDLVCELCNCRLSTPRDLAYHMTSRMHNLAEKELFDDKLTEEELEALALEAS